MNVYMVFSYDQYYPGGGPRDFVKSFPCRDDAIAFADTLTEDDFIRVYEYTGDDFREIWSNVNQAR